LLTVSRRFMNVANSLLWRMAIILKASKVNFFVYSVLFVFWYRSPNVLDTPRIRSSTVSAYHPNSYNCPHKLPTATNLTKTKQLLLLNVETFIFWNYMT
jgi:hypothetical protein